MLELPAEGDSHSEKMDINHSLATEVLKFIRKNGEYIFWEIFDFDGGKFSYAASKELFFEDRRKGHHLKGVLEEMKRRSSL